VATLNTNIVSMYDSGYRAWSNVLTMPVRSQVELSQKRNMYQKRANMQGARNSYHHSTQRTIQHRAGLHNVMSNSKTRAINR
jgi:hypothetical protein